MTDTQDLTERLRRDDDLVSRIEAADLIESLQARVAELEGVLTKAIALALALLPHENGKPVVDSPTIATALEEIAAALARKDTP